MGSSPAVIHYLREEKEGVNCNFNSMWRFFWLKAVRSQDSRELRVSVREEGVSGLPRAQPWKERDKMGG